MNIYIKTLMEKIYVPSYIIVRRRVKYFYSQIEVSKKSIIFKLSEQNIWVFCKVFINLLISNKIYIIIKKSVGFLNIKKKQSIKIAKIIITEKFKLFNFHCSQNITCKFL